MSPLSQLWRWKESLQTGCPSCSSWGLLAPRRAKRLHHDISKETVLLPPLCPPLAGRFEHGGQAAMASPEVIRHTEHPTSSREVLTGFSRYYQIHLNKPDAWMLFASGVLYIKYVESVIAPLSKDKSQQNFIRCTLSDCSLTQTACSWLWPAGDGIWLWGEEAFAFLYNVRSPRPLCLVNEWENKKHGQVGSRGKQHFGKTETVQLCSEDRFRMELWVYKEELQPCVLLFSQQNLKAACSGLSTQLKAI